MRFMYALGVSVQKPTRLSCHPRPKKFAGVGEIIQNSEVLFEMAIVNQINAILN